MHPGSKNWHLMDYIITRKRDVQDVLHTRAMCGPCAWSDHKLVKCKMALKAKKSIRQLRQKVVSKLNVGRLQSEEVQQQLANDLSNAFNQTATCDNAEDIWSQHKDLTAKIARAVLGPVKKTHRDWFDENNDKIQPLLDELHDLKARNIRDKGDSVVADAYKLANNMSRRHCVIWKMTGGWPEPWKSRLRLTNEILNLCSRT